MCVDYKIKPLCHSLHIYQFSPGIDVYVRIIVLLCDSNV